VLDCGGGPGRYAIELAKKGYAVTLFDLSARNLVLAEHEARQANATLSAYEHGTATDLSRFPDEAFDAVLLMGPLYHLLDARLRSQAICEARRVLRPGGPLFAAFITRYAALRYCAVYDTEWLVREPELTQSLLESGVLPPRGPESSAFVAYCAHPKEVPSTLREAGLDLVALLGVEGLVSMIEEGVNALSGASWDTWVDLNYRVAADPSAHSGAEHLLAVAVKPGWRHVLERVARRLNEAGIWFKVVGGAACALHGLHVQVHDIDLEMDASGAYRFQQLFAAHTVRPVSLSESETYRSHFGRFDFGHSIVEVMGDLHRREGNDWVPTAASTAITLSFENIPIRVPWLEEETLAYIRRGRLDRAAQCLPHCDHSRLVQLATGATSTNAL
jgi:SAM-dependent methyltransferase